MGKSAKTVISVAHLHTLVPIFVVLLVLVQRAAPMVDFVALRDMLAYLHRDFARL